MFLSEKVKVKMKNQNSSQEEPKSHTKQYKAKSKVPVLSDSIYIQSPMKNPWDTFSKRSDPSF
jgi:hypothetical protein